MIRGWGGCQDEANPIPRRSPRHPPISLCRADARALAETGRRSETRIRCPACIVGWQPAGVNEKGASQLSVLVRPTGLRADSPFFSRVLGARAPGVVPLVARIRLRPRECRGCRSGQWVARGTFQPLFRAQAHSVHPADARLARCGVRGGRRRSRAASRGAKTRQPGLATSTRITVMLSLPPASLAMFTRVSTLSSALRSLPRTSAICSSSTILFSPSLHNR